VGLGHPCKLQWLSRLGSVTARHSSCGRQPNFVALNRGHHLYFVGRPSRWALAHILVYHVEHSLHSVLDSFVQLSHKQFSCGVFMTNNESMQATCPGKYQTETAYVGVVRNGASPQHRVNGVQGAQNLHTDTHTISSSSKLTLGLQQRHTKITLNITSCSHHNQNK